MSEIFIHGDLDDAGLSPLQFRLLAHLARRSGPDGSAFGSIEAMAKVCGLHEKTVRKVLAELVERNAIRCVERSGQTTVRYINPVAKWKPNPSHAITPPTGVEGYSDGTPPLPRHGRTPLPRRGTQSISPEVPPLKLIPSSPIKQEALELHSDAANGAGNGVDRKQHQEDLRLRVGAWFRRRPATSWSEKERKAFTGFTPDAEQLELLHWFYSLPESTHRDLAFRRKDVLTLLHNWPGEVDRARKLKTELGSKATATAVAGNGYFERSASEIVRIFVTDPIPGSEKPETIERHLRARCSGVVVGTADQKAALRAQLPPRAVAAIRAALGDQAL